MYRVTRLATPCACILLTAWLCTAQEFPNSAKDSGESPYIQRLKASADGKDLVLRFEGKLRLGREDNAFRANTNKTFHHAIHRILVTLNNDKLDEFIIDVGPDTKGKVTVHPADCSHAMEDGVVTIRVPLSLIAFTPVDVIAETDSIHFGSEEMVGAAGRNLFSAAGEKPARISIPSLPENPEKAAISDLQIADADPTSATLTWNTSFRSRARVLLSTGGKKVQTVAQDVLTRSHRVTLTGLSPETRYQAVVAGKDFTGGTVPAKTISFTTTARIVKGAGVTGWLSVRGKYIVDSNGKPFPLGGYSVSLGDWLWNEFPRFGTIPMAARYFRSLGLNACRLGLYERTPDDFWVAGFLRGGAGAVKKFGGMEGYVKKFVRPMVEQIANEGMYVILDWHDAYGMVDAKVEKVAQFWEAAAKEFKDEPRIAMFQI
ncbi:MAG: cellulase family glycosylhydrolase, partial [Phycisphaerae bacterium]|nr:cellulase family glycosylhydrolase [Phycisphaerae bacterium]